MTTGKTIALTRRTFVDKVRFLLFNMLSRLVITFLPRSKRLLISWLQSPSTVILEPRKNKVNHCFHCFPIYLPSGSSLMSWFFPSGGRSIGASASVLPVNIQDWFPLDWLIWSPCGPRDCQGACPNHHSEVSILQHSAFLVVQLSHLYMTAEKTIA